MGREICSMARAVQFLHHLTWDSTKGELSRNELYIHIYTGWWFQRVNILLIYGYICGKYVINLLLILMA